MRLSRLEEKSILTTAMRHVVRHLHQRRNKITFNSPEAADRIDLKSSNLPTEPKELRELILKVFQRRGEEFLLNQVYQDFVKSHGRIDFDSRKEWPLCHVHTYRP